MTFDTLCEKLEQLAARRAEQDVEFAAVCSVLSSLDRGSTLRVSKAWTDAMDDATQVAPHKDGFPSGALRG
jgi:hypothetical protein